MTVRVLAMASTNWPDVGQHPASMYAHAAALKVDIARLNDRIVGGADQVPAGVLQSFSASVGVLLDKLLEASGSCDVHGSAVRTREDPGTLLVSQDPVTQHEEGRAETRASSKIVLQTVSHRGKWSCYR